MTRPLTPAECDLRDFPRMMIDIPRLFGSTFNATASRKPLAWMIAHKLWYRSWHQVPAGSLPNDDDELCHLAELGFDMTSFRDAKPLAMRGWVECDDGRLYHPVVAQAALEAWLEKLAQRLSSGAGNAKRWKIAFDPAPVHQSITTATTLLATLDPNSKALVKAARRQSQPAPAGSPVSTPDGSPDVIPSGSLETGTGIETGNSKEEEGTSSLSVEPLTRSAEGAGQLVILPGVDLQVTKPKGSAKPTAAEIAQFEAFWTIYPRKVAKQPALTAFVKAVRQGADAHAIASGAQVYAAARAGENPKHTAHAATWLNDQRWTDEPEVIPPGAGRTGRPMDGWSGVDQAVAGFDWNYDPATEDAA